MVMYRVEVVKRSKKRKKTVILFFITAILISLAIFGGIKFAKYKYMSQNPIEFNQEKDNQDAENQSKETTQENKNDVNNNEENGQNNETNNNPANSKMLTDEQIDRINNIYKSDVKRVFLTFDDGPSSAVTPKILEVLKNENIKATFFVLGTMVKSNPDLIKREREDGHYIANHGYSHVYKKVYANSKEPLAEYKKTNELIQKALEDPNYQSSVFRFPGGSSGGYYNDIKKEAKEILRQNHVAYLDWNALTNDSAGATTKEEMLKNLKSTSKNKDSVVVLMHDAPNKKDTAEALPEIIKYFRDNGYTFQNLYDIL